ncbi:uncharacterized protein [Procambarus clarkii]|uniref:uncharacterized protein n=1 Tax=Procambarus clarkii TaxID=6728 RepID=UPI003743BCAA
MAAVYNLPHVIDVKSLPGFGSMPDLVSETIWQSPASTVLWKNMPLAEKQTYKVMTHTDKCTHENIVPALAKFISKSENVLMILIGRDFIKLKEELPLIKCDIVLFSLKESVTDVLKKHENCQVLLLTKIPSKAEMKKIYLLFKGDKIICTFRPKPRFKYIFPEFEEVPIGCNLKDKFFIRKFVDEIGSPNAANWFINKLSSEEREVYTIMSQDELQQQVNSKTVKELSIIHPKTEEDEHWSLIDHMEESFPSFPLNLIKMRPEIGYHTPQKIEIEAVMRFIGQDPVLGVFSGMAFIENLIRIRHTNVVRATDNYSNMGESKWMEVEQMDAVEAVRTYCNDREVLLMSWPELICDDNVYSDAFYVLKEFKGQKLIYFGEGEGGCCACDGFFNLLDSEFHCVKSNTCFTYNSFINSNVYFYIRL